MDVERVVLGFISISLDTQAGLNKEGLLVWDCGGMNLFAHNGDAGYP